MAAIVSPTQPIPATLDSAIEHGLQWLFDRQHEDGYWMGILESNSCMEAEWLLALHFLGLHDHPLREGLVNAILNEQRDDGSWEIFHEAPTGDINSTVECYAALRSTGMSASDESLIKAREWIFANGGLQKVRVFTRYWLALIGEWPWDKTPNIPPEVIFIPPWFPFNIYNFACWARATLVPISVLSARRPVKPLPEKSRLHELFPEGRENMDYSLPRKLRKWFSWESFFRLTDRLLHTYQNWRLVTTGREVAIVRSLEWIVRHQDSDGAWGGIQPPWVYGLMALHTDGYALHHPVLAKGIGALEDFWSHERDGGTYVQACNSPVWDTLLAMMALLDCGVDYKTSPALREAVRWTLQKQVHTPGDWAVKMKNVKPGGWSFEHANEFYPDIDDTGVALIVLAQVREQLSDDPSEREAIDDSIMHAKQWLMAMQCRNGGWAAFDKDNDKEILTRIPFSDFGEALDPPSVDVTAHVLEGLGLLETERTDHAIAKALDYIREEQESEGSWFGRWGVNHIYGTAAVLPALKVLGEDMSVDYVIRAARWLVSCQNTDGGWGESPMSYMDDSLRGEGETTASQTAWAIMALLAVDGDDYDSHIQRGVDYLVENQIDGTWHEEKYTGTGFPGYGAGARADLVHLKAKLQQGNELSRGFMINYNMYRHYFPLMALGRARRYLNNA